MFPSPFTRGFSAQEILSLTYPQFRALIKAMNDDDSSSPVRERTGIEQFSHADWVKLVKEYQDGNR